MKISKSQIIAVLASLALVAWFVFHNSSDDNQTDNAAAQKQTTTEKPLPSVVVLNRTAQPREQVLELFGQSEANRQVSVKANTASVVVQTPLSEGQIVRKGRC